MGSNPILDRKFLCASAIGGITNYCLKLVVDWALCLGPRKAEERPNDIIKLTKKKKKETTVM